MTKLKPKYQPEDIVYLKTDIELLPRLVTAYKVTKHDITYECVCGIIVSYHYDFELTDNIEQLKNPIGLGK
jgi:hypothetical protein